MSKLTFSKIAESTLQKVGIPLSPREIWDKANELKITEGFSTTGKTPWATIGAYIYTDINNNGEYSTFIQTNERPAQFFLRELKDSVNLAEAEERKEKQEIEKEKAINKKFNERDLHTVLVAFAKTAPHFKSYLKTIFHEKTRRNVKGLNKWLHPDLVGVYFPFSDYSSETIEIQKELSISSVKLFSFELKVNITFGTLREYYFQAVSNSSWANEGYLVTLKLEEDSELTDEIRRLNNAFGIGLIKLNPENVFESEILFPARTSQDIDWDTVNRLAKENPDFRNFLKYISEDLKLRKVKSNYDEVLTPEQIEIYIKEKNIEG